MNAITHEQFGHENETCSLRVVWKSQQPIIDCVGKMCETAVNNNPAERVLSGGAIAERGGGGGPASREVKGRFGFTTPLMVGPGPKPRVNPDREAAPPPPHHAFFLCSSK